MRDCLNESYWELLSSGEQYSLVVDFPFCPDNEVLARDKN